MLCTRNSKNVHFPNTCRKNKSSFYSALIVINYHFLFGSKKNNLFLLSPCVRDIFVKHQAKGSFFAFMLTVGSKMVEDELDILLVSCGESEVATMWVDYLITCFQRISSERRKPPFKWVHNVELFWKFVDSLLHSNRCREVSIVFFNCFANWIVVVSARSYQPEKKYKQNLQFLNWRSAWKMGVCITKI